MNRLSLGGSTPRAALITKDKAMDPIYTYFFQNIDMVSKEELLEALENALRSAACWREACLFWPSNQNIPVMNSLKSKEHNNV